MHNNEASGLVDIHAHILPFADDGAKDVESALELVKIAREEGVRTVFLTPHHRGVYRKNTPERLRELFADFSRTVKEHYPDMMLYLGAEIAYHSNTPEQLTQGDILTLGDSHYVLLEFRVSSLRSQIVTAVAETVRFGYTPVIAHAERYNAFREDESLAEEVLEMGGLIQLNADSIMGSSGLRVKWYCHRLLKAGQVQFVASDAHDARQRPPRLRDCCRHVARKYGTEYAARIFRLNAQAVIEDRTL